MKYDNVVKAKFLARPNRFVAKVELDGEELTVHVKNTGRCKELLVPGCTVVLSKSDNPARKTAYDLIATYKEGRLFNMDSQAPNQAVKEWLSSTDGVTYVKPEFTYGESRIDFYYETGAAGAVASGIASDDLGAASESVDSSTSSDSGMVRHLLEIKGCTLERDMVGYFPDAPTDRGIKHIKELARAHEEDGYECAIGFVIQTEGVTEVYPNDETHPAFGVALRDAARRGVRILCFLTTVSDGEMVITEVYDETEKVLAK